MADPTQAPVTDPWSVLDYKEFDGPRAAWLSDADRRRLGAYMVYAAYLENQGSRYGQTDERREYGDPALLVEQALAHLLGESQTIEVAEAGDTDAEGKPTNAAAADAQAWLEEWADRENFLLRVIDAERKAVSLGDAVYVIDVDQDKGRPRLGVYDPGFYFPVLPDSAATDDYPERVHFAWEEEVENTAGKVERQLRRITYQLVEAETPYRTAWGESTATKQLQVTDHRYRLEGVGGARRDGVALDRIKGTPIEVAPPVRVQIDFLPIVHMPNTLPGGDHYGQSLLAKVMQLLDDLQAADTDTQAAQSTTGSPMLLLQGAPSGPLDLGPGKAIRLEAGGDGKVLDTSGQLAAMAKQVEGLRDRLTENARIPDVALGRVRSAADAGMSGVALTLRFGPLEAMIRQMRMVRTEKYRLLLRFVQRIGMTMGKGPAEAREARLVLGAFLPRDVDGTIKAVAEGVRAKVVSLETGVRMLIAAGVPAEDVTEEVRRIVSRDYESAGALADATGDVNDARALLGLTPAPESQGAPVVEDVAPTA